MQSETINIMVDRLIFFVILFQLLNPISSYTQAIQNKGLEVNMEMERELSEIRVRLFVRNNRDSAVFLVKTDPYHFNLTSKNNVIVWMMNPYSNYLDHKGEEIELLMLESGETLKIEKVKKTKVVDTVLFNVELISMDNLKRNAKSKMILKKFQKSIRVNKPKISVLYFSVPNGENHIKYEWHIEN